MKKHITLILICSIVFLTNGQREVAQTPGLSQIGFYLGKGISEVYLIPPVQFQGHIPMKFNDKLNLGTYFTTSTVAKSDFKGTSYFVLGPQASFKILQNEKLISLFGARAGYVYSSAKVAGYSSSAGGLDAALFSNLTLILPSKKSGLFADIQVDRYANLGFSFGITSARYKKKRKSG